MCIRDRLREVLAIQRSGDRTRANAFIDRWTTWDPALHEVCLLYTSDAADERSSVDLGGRRIIKKKKQTQI